MYLKYRKMGENSRHQFAKENLSDEENNIITL